MAIRITPLEGAQLKLSGDVEDVISLSSRAIRVGCAVAFSDGTLVRGSYDRRADQYRFELIVEGAGIAKIGRGDHGDTLDLAWKIEWISLAAATDMRCPKDQDWPEIQQELPLIERVKVAA